MRSTPGATISGRAGKLAKRGAGILGLSGANSYAGGTVLEEGVLVAGSPSAFGTGGLCP